MTARCPACAELGNDKTGNHLKIWQNHSFNCIVSGKEHNQRTLQLIGTAYDSNYIAPVIIEEKLPIQQTWDISILNELVKNYDYWINRGISRETCEKFRIGLAGKGQMAGRSVIHILDRRTNKIIGFTGRATYADPKAKYKHLGEKKHWLFPANDESIKHSESIILLEGPADALYLDTHGVTNTLCLFGTSISGAIIGYMIRMNIKRILIATNNEPDNNNIGLNAAINIKEKLMQFFNEDRIHIALPQKKDFLDLSVEELEEYKLKWQLC